MLSMKEIPYRSADELATKGYTLKNALISKIDIEVIGHFGNVVTLSIVVSSGCMSCDFMGGYSLTKNLGSVIQVLFDVLGIQEDNGVSLKSLVEKPLRMVQKDGNRYIGFGNFCDDNKILLLDDLFDAIEKAEERKQD